MIQFKSTQDLQKLDPRVPAHPVISQLVHDLIEVGGFMIFLRKSMNLCPSYILMNQR